MHVIDSADRWPEFVLALACHRVSRLFTSVWMCPDIADDHFRRVRGIFQNVVQFIGIAMDDRLDFGVD